MYIYHLFRSALGFKVSTIIFLLLCSNIVIAGVPNDSTLKKLIENSLVSKSSYNFCVTQQAADENIKHPSKAMVALANKYRKKVISRNAEYLGKVFQVCFDNDIKVSNVHTTTYRNPYGNDNLNAILFDVSSKNTLPKISSCKDRFDKNGKYIGTVTYIGGFKLIRKKCDDTYYNDPNW